VRTLISAGRASEVSGRVAQRWLLLVALLTVWGPPALRTSGRGLDTALVDPFTFDAAAMLQVGAWLCADALVLILLMSHVARGTSFLPRLLQDRPLRWYGLFGLLGLGSVTYSSSPSYTAFFAQKIIVGILLLSLLEWHWPARHGSRSLQVLFWVFALQAAAIGVLYFAHREWVSPFAAELIDVGKRPRITGGVFADYGSSALLAGLCFLYPLLFGRTQLIRLLAGAAYACTWILMILSETRSTMAAGLVFLVVMLASKPEARVLAALVGAGSCITVVTLLPNLSSGIVNTGTRQGEGLSTLSGRTVAFSYLIDRWHDSPLIGYGFGSGARNLLIDFVARSGLNIGAGHDALSTVLADLGLFGLALLVTTLVASWIALFRLYRSTVRTGGTIAVIHQVLCLLIWVTMQTVVGASLAGPSMVFIVCLVTMSTLRRQAASSRVGDATTVSV
jgi:hypothetical protein